MLRKFLPAALALALLAPLATAETADELIEKNIKAKGGREKLKSVQVMRFTGKMVMGQGLETPFVMTIKRPKSMRMEFTVQGLTGIQAYDGKTGWTVMPFTGKKDPEQVPAEDAKNLDEQADFDGPLIDYKAKGNQVELVGREEVEGTNAYKLKVTLKSGDVRYFYLDPDAFLEIKTEGKRVMRGSEIEYESSLGDYKPVDGVMIAHSMEMGVKGMAQRQKLVIDKVEMNPTAPDSLFAMPATAGASATQAAAAKSGEKADSTAASKTATKTTTKGKKTAK